MSAALTSVVGALVKRFKAGQLDRPAAGPQHDDKAEGETRKLP